MIYPIDLRMTFIGFALYFWHTKKRGQETFGELLDFFDHAERYAAKHFAILENHHFYGKTSDLAWNMVMQYPKIPRVRHAKGKPFRNPARVNLRARMEFIGEATWHGILRKNRGQPVILPELLDNAIWFSIAYFAFLKRYRKFGEIADLGYEFAHVFPKPAQLVVPFISGNHYYATTRSSDDVMRKLYFNQISEGHTPGA